MFGRKKDKKTGLGKKGMTSKIKPPEEDTEVELDPVATSGIKEESAESSAIQFSSDQESKPDPIYNFLLITSLVAFIGVIIIAGMEAYDFYDVGFMLFKK